MAMAHRPSLGSSFPFLRHGFVHGHGLFDAQEAFFNPETISFQDSPWLMGNFTSGTNQVWLRQQPEKSRVVVKGREKEKKPIDPPPVLQLHMVNDPSFIHNPYLFCSCEIWDAVEDREATNPNPSTPGGNENQLLIGQLVSSLHRLKDLDNSEKGFFVFGDLAVIVTGKFRLRFCVWEYSLSGYATFIKDCFSAPFEVASAKEWDGVKESTPLSRAIADQGIKLRLRKESRHPKGSVPPSAGPVSSVSTPLRPASYSQDGMTRSSSVATTPYSTYTSPGAQTGAYPGYPPTSSANMQATYYNAQYPSAYPAGSYGYAAYGQAPQQSQQQYSASAGSPYRPQPTQAESISSYTAPTSYAGGSYPYQGGYAPSASSYSHPQAGAQSAGRGYMADPSNPPRLAPISGHDARAQQQGQPPMKEESRQSYDWANQNR